MRTQVKESQVKNHDGDCIDVIVELNELVDVLSRHTNNKLKSNIHQLVNPQREL